VPDALLLLGAWLAYAACRAPFATLPLHRDTGFYVPNYSVQTRRFGPFSGWNTYFSGGSRALPQFVHTALYLACGSRRYAQAYRWLYTLLAFATACLIGGLASLLWDAGDGSFWVALPLALALLAEAQYGAYFESAEVFETLCHAAGVWLVLRGLAHGAELSVVLGVGLLWLDAVAIKVTGAAVAGAVSLALLWLDPTRLWMLGALAATAVLVYLAWVRASGVGVKRLFELLARHERYVRRNYPSAVLLLAVKLGFAARLALRNPVLPGLALVGAVLVTRDFQRDAGLQPATLVLVAYGAGVLAGWLRQGHRVWYYQLPFVPLLVLLGVAALQALPVAVRLQAALALGALSTAFNLWPVLRRDLETRNFWLFQVYDRPGLAAGSAMAAGNAALARCAPELRARVAGHTMLVLGPLNQASLLCDAGYATPLTTLCELTDAVAGPPGPWLESALRERAPVFVLDTDGSFDRYAGFLAEAGEYGLIEQHGPLRLFGRAAVSGSS
jgi:hypothetical protein